jgi:hypothetical protein
MEVNNVGTAYLGPAMSLSNVHDRESAAHLFGGFGGCVMVSAFLAFTVPASAYQTEWKPSPQTFKQLVDDGYEIKGFGVHSYGPRNVEGVFVLQKAGSVYQCYEFSILKDDLTTSKQSLNCFELTAPYDRQLEK